MDDHIWAKVNEIAQIGILKLVRLSIPISLEILLASKHWVPCRLEILRELWLSYIQLAEIIFGILQAVQLLPISLINRGRHHTRLDEVRVKDLEFDYHVDVELIVELAVCHL